MNSDPLNETGSGARGDNFLADSGSTCECAPTKERILTAQGATL